MAPLAFIIAVYINQTIRSIPTAMRFSKVAAVNVDNILVASNALAFNVVIVTFDTAKVT